MSARPSWRSRCTLGGHLTHDDLKRYRVELREPLYWRHDGATRRAQPAARGERRADRLRPCLSRGACRARPRHRCAGTARAPWKPPTRRARRTARGSPQRLAGGALAKELREAARHPPAYRGTTHVSVIDADGNAAAVSLSNGEGNGFIVGKFRLHAEQHAGRGGSLGRRPRCVARRHALSSMMAPTIILAARRHGDGARHRRLEPHQDRDPPGRRQSARSRHEPRCARSKRRGCMSSATAQ